LDEFSRSISDHQRLERYHHQQVTQARFSANLAAAAEQVDPQYHSPLN
jgi:hypothetical protein